MATSARRNGRTNSISSFFRLEAIRPASLTVYGSSTSSRQTRKATVSDDCLDEALNPLLKDPPFIQNANLPSNVPSSEQLSPRKQGCDLNKPLPPSPSTDSAPKAPKARPLSWLSITKISITKGPLDKSHPGLTQNDSCSSVARSTISAPVLHSTSNASIAQLEGVQSNLDRAMTGLTKISSGLSTAEDGQNEGRRKGRFKTSKEAFYRVKGVFTRKMRGAGPSRLRPLSRTDKFERIDGHDVVLRASSSTDRHISILGPSDPTTEVQHVTIHGYGYGQPKHRRNRLSQSSVRRRQMAVQQAVADFEHQKSDALPPPIESTYNDRAHLDFGSSDLEKSFCNAVDNLNFEDRAGKLKEGVHGRKRSATSTLRSKLSKSVSDRPPSRTTGDNGRQQDHVRDRPKTLPGGGGPYFNPLIQHPDVMKFDEGPPGFHVKFDKSSNYTVGSKPPMEISTPRIEITKDDDQTTADLEDAPIFSESMNNLSQYARTTPSSGRSTPSPGRTLGFGPADLHKLPTFGTPTRPPYHPDNALHPAYKPKMAPASAPKAHASDSCLQRPRHYQDKPLPIPHDVHGSYMPSEFNQPSSAALTTKDRNRPMMEQQPQTPMARKMVGSGTLRGNQSQPQPSSNNYSAVSTPGQTRSTPRKMLSQDLLPRRHNPAYGDGEGMHGYGDNSHYAAQDVHPASQRPSSRNKNPYYDPVKAKSLFYDPEKYQGLGGTRRC